MNIKINPIGTGGALLLGFENKILLGHLTGTIRNKKYNIILKVRIDDQPVIIKPNDNWKRDFDGFYILFIADNIPDYHNNSKMELVVDILREDINKDNDIFTIYQSMIYNEDDDVWIKDPDSPMDVTEEDILGSLRHVPSFNRRAHLDAIQIAEMTAFANRNLHRANDILEANYSVVEELPNTDSPALIIKEDTDETD